MYAEYGDRNQQIGFRERAEIDAKRASLGEAAANYASKTAQRGGSLGESVARRPELAEFMERSATALGYTEELVQALEKRLSMVSAPSAPATCSNPEGSSIAQTYYGQQLSALIERLSMVNGTLRGMMDRLEA
jgi:hypothetical protein